MPAQTLRDYQVRGRQAILDAFKGGARSVLAVSPTGSGKTTLFGHLVAELDARQRPTLILVHRRELAAQARNRLREFGVPHGVIMAGETPTPYARAQVASVDTLVRRAVPPAALVIADEAHLSTAPKWRRVLEQYPSARILGVTASPWRLSGKPLSSAYDAVVVVATPRELREQGHLCDYVGFSYLTPDLSGIATTAGDYNEQQSAAAMSSSLIVDNIVEEWTKHAAHLSTVVFGVTVEHSRQLVERFRAAGATAEHLDGTTPLAQREAIMRRVASGQTRVLCNVGVVIEGLDIPRLKCCVLARPTKSLARAIQMMGRVRRPWVECQCGHAWAPSRLIPACVKCGSVSFQHLVARIHDHAFVIRQHGLPDADRDYTLTAKRETPPSLATCPECFATYDGMRCPSCGVEKESEPLGERVLQTVAEAEQYEFTSATEAAPEREERAPTKVDWSKPGRVVDGVYLRRDAEEVSWGTRTRHIVRGEKRDYSLAGTSQLDRKLALVSFGTPVTVEHTHDSPRPGGKFQREFRVQWDDGQPEVTL